MDEGDDMRYWDAFPPYVPVAEKKVRASKKLAQLKKKYPNLKPVALEGRTIAKTWWGKAWNRNLEEYADYSNRIGRGSSYLHHGAVLDLQIGEGKVTALVQGSQSKPYSVEISIASLHKAAHNAIRCACEERIGSLEALLAGQFPKELGEAFTVKGKGLFPSPKEISFSCSCPDWASMCKHVAAVLYGIGARLDSEPHIFFVLRKVDINAFIAKTVTDHAHKLTTGTKQKSARVIEDMDVTAVFGIEFDEPVAAPKPKATKREVKEKSTLSKLPDKPVRCHGKGKIETAAPKSKEPSKEKNAAFKSPSRKENHEGFAGRKTHRCKEREAGCFRREKRKIGRGYANERLHLYP